MKKIIKKIVGKKITAKLTEIAVTRSVKKLVAETRDLKHWTAAEAIELLFAKKARFVTPWQYREEILALAKEIEKKRPKVVLEVGTASGGTLFLATRLAADDALIISIDLPNGMYGGGYPDWKISLYTSFARAQQKIELIRADSHAPVVLQQLKDILNGRKIDYIFLDGDHTYEGVKQDFDTFSDLAAPGALIAFHDIVSDKSPKPDHFVSVFWNETKPKFEHKEFIKDPEQSKLGLGLLLLKN
jgi:cephalosporin hydroxylase